MSFYPSNIKISIIIPVLNEQEHINPLLCQLKRINAGELLQVIIIDGDKNASTIKSIKPSIIKDNKDFEIISEVAGKGRAAQMNKGASRAMGNWLLFLHADTRLPEAALKEIASVADQKKYLAGAFDLGIDSKRFIIKFIEIMANVRSHITRMPYGDQAIFIQKKYFEKIGGYPKIPLMEDLELMRRIKKNKNSIALIHDKVHTSSRRWDREGAIYSTLRNWTLAILYVFGVSPLKLVKFYEH